MKMIKPLFATALCSAMFAHADAKEYAIAYSPFLDPEKAKAIAAQSVEWMAGLEAGDRVMLIDGYNISTLGVFAIPENERYNNSRARVMANAAAVGALMRFAEASSLPTGGDQPTSPGAVRLPQTLRHVVTAIPAASDTEVDVAVIGSPIFDDPAERAYSMAGGPIFPSDGHIKASRGSTPYGTAGQETLLENVRVHMGVTGLDQHSDQYLYLLERFWTLSVEGQGGEMVSYLSDITTLFTRLNSGAAAPVNDFELSVLDKLEMLMLVPRDPNPTIFEREVETRVFDSNALQGASNVQVGLSWDCTECDLDLYARPYPDARVLHFAETDTAEGRYWKDFRMSPRSIRGYETIEFTVPLDLRRLQLLVNFYEGSAPDGVRGELRVSVNGVTYAKAFHLDVTSGNDAEGVMQALESNRSGSPQTVLISPLEVLGVN
jgi:hypothetical protein